MTRSLPSRAASATTSFLAGAGALIALVWILLGFHELGRPAGDDGGYLWWQWVAFTPGAAVLIAVVVIFPWAIGAALRGKL